MKAKESDMMNKQIWFPGPLALDNMVGETKSGLRSVFTIQCSKCGKINNVHIHPFLVIIEQVAEGQKPVTLILEQFLAHFTLELDKYN